MAPCRKQQPEIAHSTASDK